MVPWRLRGVHNGDWPLVQPLKLDGSRHLVWGRLMRNPSEPFDRELHDAKLSRYRDLFIAGSIGEATYRVSLEILGLRGQDVTAEINLAKMEMRGRPKKITF